MPLLWGRPLMRSHAPSLEPDSSASVNKLAATPVEGSDPQTGTKGRQSFHTGIKRLFKGEAKSKDTHPDASAKRLIQNIGQPSQSLSVTDSLQKAPKTSGQSPLAELLGIPTAEPGTNPDQLGGSDHAHFAGSNPESDRA
ncbi:hypothetical protein P691DRAFT_123562 [Macrolepiota fuliginosa MF-IS2]|uniref:Uncharacterized protein n=1 Tax=Macrolepiota fuliginosa MF-IS2 TaxID=1400762 RepID=A0A9P5X9N6_9AGAR|nr:hypothetical protein P691DRAFT_123562 [Macrolepiota fuliginosa MF-IS2]